MTDVTVEQLATSTGVELSRLLLQMKQAGLPQQLASDVVSTKEKQALLAFLNREAVEKSKSRPNKISLQRKTTTVLTNQSSQKQINVEVRKKRTFVKKDAKELAADIFAHQKVNAASPTEKGGSSPDMVPEKTVSSEAGVAEKPVEKKIKTKQPEQQIEPVATPYIDPNFTLGQKVSTGVSKLKTSASESTGRATASVKQKQPSGAVVKDKPSSKKNNSVSLEKKKAVSVKPGDLMSLKFDGNEGRKSTSRNKKLKGKAALTALAQQKNEHAFTKPTAPVVHDIELPGTITVGELAKSMAEKTGDVVKSLMKMGVMATINQRLDQDTATLVVEDMGHRVVKLVSENDLEESLLGSVVYTEDPEPRAPVVTVMGHVDHGKTSLLDYIRKTRVASGESGGITQHIGAYHVKTPQGMVSFLDTPGHAAFTAMRARGAQCTDVVILVVAADDGVMPQTEEAISHAKASGVALVVAINKMDKEGADVDRVKNELSQREVIPEDWGGDVQCIPVSAHTGSGIDELLSAVLLQSELLELKAVKSGPAQGVVVESRLDKGRGPVSTLLVQAGCFKRGDIVLSGTYYGRVKSLLNENGEAIDQAGPSTPVELLGLNGMPDAGDTFVVVDNEKTAREVADNRDVRKKEQVQQRQQAAKLDSVLHHMGENTCRQLNVILKVDVRGSLEALVSALKSLGTDEVEVIVISSGVGGITESDVTLAHTSKAMLFGFNVRADAKAKIMVENCGLEMRYYSVIYDLIDDVKASMSGLLKPELREKILGLAQVRDVFKSTKFGLIAGCMVTEGTIYRHHKIRVLRDNVVVYEGELESLRRFKEDAQEVRQGIECGIGVKHYQDVRVGDQIEVFEVQSISRSI